MKVRIIRVSAFESAIARFDAWWDSRAPRERLLLGILGALLGAAILIFAVILPLQRARAQAFADIRTYETLNARIRAAGTLTPQRSQPRTGSTEEVITGSARALGLDVKVEEMTGDYRAVITNASYDTVIAWLADLGATSKLKVSGVTFTRGSGPGQVNAVVDF